MLFTIYTDNKLQNIDYITIHNDSHTYYIDIILYQQQRAYPLTVRAFTYEQHLMMQTLMSDFVYQFLYYESRSKTLNKNMYRSWRGEVMNLHHNLLKGKMEFVQDLEVILYYFTTNNYIYTDYKDYNRYIKLYHNNQIDVITGVVDKGTNLQFETFTGHLYLFPLKLREKTSLEDMGHFFDNLLMPSAQDTKVPSLTTFLQSEVFRQKVLETVLFTPEHLDIILKEHTSYSLQTQKEGDTT